jgi:DNA repair exonuclease SbcCD ATPase subunit
LHRKKSSCSSSSSSPAAGDDEIDHYRQMLQQTQQALALCQLELQQQQQPIKALCEVIRKQDQLIHTLTNQPTPPPPPQQQHEETWQALRHELDRLKMDRHTYEAQIRALRRDLESSQNETRQLATLARLLMVEKAHQDDNHPPTLTPSETTTTATMSIDDDNAYREFTQQLHTRLSLSDDITLTLYDYAALDKAAAADKRTSTSSHDTTTHFWKGMKKRLATIKTAGPVS